MLWRAVAYVLRRWCSDSRTDAFAYGTFVMQPGVEPLGHLMLPVRDVGKLVPTACAMFAAGDADDHTTHAYFVQGRLQVRGFGKWNVFILIAEDFEKWRIAFGDVGDGRGFADGFLFAFLRDEWSEQAMDVCVEWDEFEAALRVEADYGLCLGADAIDRIRRGQIAGRVEQAYHVAEEASGRTADKCDLVRIGVPLLCVIAYVADGALHIENHVGIGIPGGETVVHGEDCVAGGCEKIGDVGFAAALAVAAVIAAAVNDDGDGVRPCTLGRVVVHCEGLVVGCAVEDAFLSGDTGFCCLRHVGGQHADVNQEDSRCG